MFNYFQRRCVVDVANKDRSEGLSSVRVFGAKNTIDDWKNRGEYYLQNAEGDRQKGWYVTFYLHFTLISWKLIVLVYYVSHDTQHSLRLAAKCFDKAGDMKRRDFALAYLSYTEIEDQESTRRRAKQSHEVRKRLYQITNQLLEARGMNVYSCSITAFQLYPLTHFSLDTLLVLCRCWFS